MFTPSITLDVLTKATVLRFTDETDVDTGAGTGWDGIAGIASASVSAAELVITDPNDEIFTVNCLADIAAASPVIAGEDIVFDDLTGEWVDGYYNVDYKVKMVSDAFTKVEDYSGTVAGTVKITAAGHLVTTGMKVTIVSVTGDYDGDFSAVRIDGNTFYIVSDFTTDDTGTFVPFYSTVFTPFVYANVEMALERMYATFAAMDEGTEADEYLKHCEDVMGLYNSLKHAIATASSTIVNNIYGRITRILDFYSIELTYS